MHSRTLLTRLFQENIFDEEKPAHVSTLSRTSRNLKVAEGPEELGSDIGLATHSRGTTCENDGNLEDDDDTLPGIDLDGQPYATLPGPLRLLTRLGIPSTIFPSPSDEEEIQAYIPHYRVLPILSGVAIPFCIILDIPGLLTADWYIRIHVPTTIASKPNPPLLDVIIALGLLCAVLANVCLVIRFLESRIKTMTILCIVFLSIHSVINISAHAAFGATRGDYRFSQAFWTTFCSTLVSTFTNVTLVIDLIKTSDFTRSGSGLTRKQRSLIVIIIGLFCYIVLGTLVNSLLMDLTFINGLYFTVVTIELLGFGDIVPKSISSRIFIFIYAPLGAITLAFVVAYVRETVLEGLDFGYRQRLLAIQERRRATRLQRRSEKRWRRAIIWRLRERQVPIWIPKKTESKSPWSILSFSWRTGRRVLSTAWRSTLRDHPQYGMQLNLWALPPYQLESAALEAGCTLDTFLPADFYDAYDKSDPSAGVQYQILPSWFVIHPIYRRDEHTTNPLTHRRLGAMAAILTRVTLAIHESGGNPLQSGHSVQDDSVATLRVADPDNPGSLQTKDEGDYRTDVEETEMKAYYTRSSLTCFLLCIFWVGGAAIFKATEGWTYGQAIYFCFVSLTTIGYGDVTPSTPAGRSIFIVWTLIGVTFMTIFISVVSEAYTARYKNLFARNSLEKHVRNEERNKDESSEKIQHEGISTGVKFVLDEREKIHVVRDEIKPTTLEVASSSRIDLQAQDVQRSLERLPGLILTETQSIQKYMRLFDEHLAEAGNFVDDTVMGGRKLTEDIKKDILTDGESRHMLMLLGITRSLKTLVNISEQAITAIREYRIIATSKQLEETDQDEAEIIV